MTTANPVCWKHLTDHIDWESCTCKCHSQDEERAAAEAERSYDED